MTAIVSGCVVGGGEQTHRFEDLEGIFIELGSGDVEVWGTEDRGATTEVQLDLGGVGRDTARGTLTVRDDGWLHVDARGGPLGGGHIEARVPAGLPVEVLVERGDIDIVQELPADLYGCAAAGSVHMEVPAGGYQLELDGGAGAIDTRGVWHDPDADHTLHGCFGAGDVDIVGR
jgi:hypothetical protein